MVMQHTEEAKLTFCRQAIDDSQSEKTSKSANYGHATHQRNRRQSKCKDEQTTAPSPKHTNSCSTDVF